MKKVSEFMLLTFCFSGLAGLGLTAGFFCFLGVARLITKVVA